MPDIYFRADGNSTIGWGHIMRCLALADMLKNDFHMKFITVNPDENIIRLITASTELIPLSSENDEFISLINPGSIVVLDGYNFEASLQKRIKEEDIKLVCIDDLTEDYFYADLVINHAASVKKEAYRSQEYTRFLLGFPFLILREKFLAATRFRKERTEIKSLIICFGGADELNLANSFTQFALASKLFEKITVISRKSIHSYSSIVKKIDFANADQLIELFQDHDLAILPSSTLSLEAAAVGTGIISGYYVENQKRIYDGLIQHKLVFGLNNYAEITEEIFIELLNKITVRSINDQIRNQIVSVDGRSGQRILSEFKRLIPAA